MFRICLGTAAILLAFTPVVEAGNIFMKNGYIIQGKITEADEHKVVMSWPNGSMVIHQRFIEQVSLEPGEEDEMRRRAELAERAAQSNVRDEERLEQHVLIDLPEDIEEILAMRRSQTSGGAAGGVAVDGTTEGGEVEVHTLLPPQSLQFPEIGVSLSPPEGWVIEREDDRVALFASETDPLPSFTLSVFRRPMPMAMAEDALRDVLIGEFPAAKILGEREQQVGLQRALVVEGELPERSLFFTQVLLKKGDDSILIGMQVDLPVDSSAQQALEQMRHSIRFLD